MRQIRAEGNNPSTWAFTAFAQVEAGANFPKVFLTILKP
jgi:hypothetical protein